MGNDNFLTNIKNMNKENDKYEDKAFKSIVNNLFINNIRGQQKARNLDEYDSESNGKLMLMPGHIYTFKYMADKTTKYNDGRISFEYYDTTPIILCTGLNNNVISGINLNLCNFGLRTLILNTIYNIDPLFFDSDASIQAHKGLIPVSKNISSFFIKKENQALLLNTLKQRYNLKNTGLIFRTYSIDKIQNIRFVEPWQWKYIPFVKYDGSIKQSILQMIQHITGIDNIKI